MQQPAYKPIKSLRFWRAAALDSGVASVAEVLRNGLDDVRLLEVEFMDCGVGPTACAALGNALMLGGNTSLRSLRLDLNAGVGDDGAEELAKGLRTNRTLASLSLTYCRLGLRGAHALGAAIASPLCALASVDVSGNQLGSEGLSHLARAARHSKTLTKLVLCDNGIGGGPVISRLATRDAAAAASGKVAVETVVSALRTPAASLDDPMTGTGYGDIGVSSKEMTSAACASLTLLGEALVDPACGLAQVDVSLNALSVEEAEVLVPFLKPDNKKVTMFKVDTSLPPPLFAALSRAAISSGKASKKGKLAKKKSKK
jgi:Ran GTPase-activating protein (RanGAP) involved in mRNA processing and transport